MHPPLIHPFTEALTTWIEDLGTATEGLGDHHNAVVGHGVGHLHAWVHALVGHAQQGSLLWRGVVVGKFSGGVVRKEML